jgi:hypothetical protein
MRTVAGVRLAPDVSRLTDHGFFGLGCQPIQDSFKFETVGFEGCVIACPRH